MRESNSREKCWAYGKSFSEEHKNNMSKAQTGEKHSQAKLTEEDVRNIRILFRDTDITVREVSEMYNVSKGAINGVKFNKTWKHVTI